MNQYEDLLKDVLNNGKIKTDRTGIGTLSVFGRQMRFNLQEGFPLITTKKMHLKSIIYELLWFLKGDINIKYLNENGVTIWDEWADENGNLGPIYGHQWRSWTGSDGIAIDQISEIINTLKKNPDSRRIILNAWNVTEISKMAIPPCHLLFQFYVIENKLSCLMYQRSADMFLGVPFNISSYALLTMMFAHVCNFELGEFIHCLGDTHIYLNHIEQVKLQLSRPPRPYPKMLLNKERKNIFEFKYEDFQLVNYNPYPGIKADIAI